MHERHFRAETGEKERLLGGSVAATEYDRAQYRLGYGRRFGEAVSAVTGFQYKTENYPYGAEHFLKTGETFPDSALRAMKDHDAILLGAVGHVRAGSPTAVLRGELESAGRSAQINTFGGGVNEIQREIIAWMGLGMSRGKR